jgi:hypothetical protein
LDLGNDMPAKTCNIPLRSTMAFDAGRSHARVSRPSKIAARRMPVPPEAPAP